MREPAEKQKPWNTNWYSTAESMSILRFVPTLALSKSGQVEGITPSSQPAAASSLEFVVVTFLPVFITGRSRLAGLLSRRNTASHRSCQAKALPSACRTAVRNAITSFPKKKQRHLISGASERIRLYDFLRRHYPHQVKGSKFDDFLSACYYKLPCSVLIIVHLLI